MDAPLAGRVVQELVQLRLDRVENVGRVDGLVKRHRHDRRGGGTRHGGRQDEMLTLQRSEVVGVRRRRLGLLAGLLRGGQRGSFGRALLGLDLDLLLPLCSFLSLRSSLLFEVIVRPQFAAGERFLLRRLAEPDVDIDGDAAEARVSVVVLT